MKTFTLPDLGEGLQQAEVISWHVSVGDRVITDQPLLSVETDKAVVDVPAPWSGTVSKLHASPGTMVATGAALADIDTDAGQDDVGTIVGELPRSASEPRTAGIKAAPAARELAKVLGVDLATIEGSGPGGTITREDVELTQTAVSEWEPLRRVRRAMAQNMTQAHAEVATTNVTEEALLLNWSADEPVTLRLIRAMVAACNQVPALNVWYDSKKSARLMHSEIDLGMAMNTEDGLFVPVLRDIGNRSLEDIRENFSQLKTGVTSRTVASQDLRNPTITLSNFGMVGGRHAVLVIMPPQVAILGAGRITQEPRVVDGEIRPCRVLPLSLTFDHRAVTGVEAARFLMSVISDLEK